MYLSHTELLPHLRFAPVGAGHVPPAHSTFKSMFPLIFFEKFLMLLAGQKVKLLAGKPGRSSGLFPR